MSEVVDQAAPEYLICIPSARDRRWRRDFKALAPIGFAHVGVLNSFQTYVPDAHLDSCVQCLLEMTDFVPGRVLGKTGRSTGLPLGLPESRFSSRASGVAPIAVRRFSLESTRGDSVRVRRYSSK